jgi:hypothetical protein
MVASPSGSSSGCATASRSPTKISVNTRTMA